MHFQITAIRGQTDLYYLNIQEIDLSRLDDEFCQLLAEKTIPILDKIHLIRFDASLEDTAIFMQAYTKQLANHFGVDAAEVCKDLSNLFAKTKYFICHGHSSVSNIHMDYIYGNIGKIFEDKRVSNTSPCGRILTLHFLGMHKVFYQNQYGLMDVFIEECYPPGYIETISLDFELRTAADLARRIEQDLMVLTSRYFNEKTARTHENLALYFPGYRDCTVRAKIDNRDSLMLQLNRRFNKDKSIYYDHRWDELFDVATRILRNTEQPEDEKR